MIQSSVWRWWLITMSWAEFHLQEHDISANVPIPFFFDDNRWENKTGIITSWVVPFTSMLEAADDNRWAGTITSWVVPFISMLEAADDNRWAGAVIRMFTNGADDRSYKHLHPSTPWSSCQSGEHLHQENICIRKTSEQNSASVGTSPDHPALSLLPSSTIICRWYMSLLPAH